MLTASWHYQQLWGLFIWNARPRFILNNILSRWCQHVYKCHIISCEASFSKRYRNNKLLYWILVNTLYALRAWSPHCPYTCVGENMPLSVQRHFDLCMTTSISLVLSPNRLERNAKSNKIESYSNTFAKLYVCAKCCSVFMVCYMRERTKE